MSKSSTRVHALVAFTGAFLFAQLAYASGGADPLGGFFDKIIDWVQGTIAPGITVLGFIAAGICWAISGAQEGVRRAVGVAIGAGFIWGATSLYVFIAQAAAH